MSTHEVSWTEVAERLRPSRSYWLATTALDGSPHVTPVWAVVVEDVLFFYSERSTVKARNIAHDDRVSVNLPDGEDVVIVQGRVVDLGRPLTRPDVVAAIRREVRPADRPRRPAVRRPLVQRGAVGARADARAGVAARRLGRVERPLVRTARLGAATQPDPAVAPPIDAHVLQ